MFGWVYRPLDAACKCFDKVDLPHRHFIAVVAVIGVAIAAIGGGIGVGTIRFVQLYGVAIAAGADLT